MWHQQESDVMATASSRKHKHFQLDSAKIKRAQKALRTKTETETVERALDLAIAEHQKNRLALQATERFAESGIEIRDAYAKLGG
jgi:Arc/MetJ family transcription regulator